MFKLPLLPYSYSTLEPVIDTKTMEIHHTKHHQTYVDKLNTAISKYPELENKSVEELLTSLDTLPEDIRVAVRNHGGGHFNHSQFWTMMRAPIEDNKPEGKIAEEINKSFGDFSKFKEKFAETAVGVFGSGWAWLILNKDGNLEITKSANQDSPISTGNKILLALDIWEHAYYLKYQNKRAEYIEGWWKVVNWQEVEKRYGEVGPSR